MSTLALLPPGMTTFLAQAQPGAPGSDRGEEFGKTSPIALVVVLLLLIATVLLIRSMNSRLRNVPASFDPPDDETPAEGDGAGAPEAVAGDEPDGRTGPDRSEGTPTTGSP